MNDIIRRGDIVAYSSNNSIKVGKVVYVENSMKSFLIVPIKGGHRVKRKASELITASRLLKYK